jgi:hypothetical protein
MTRATHPRRWQPPKFTDEELDEDRVREALVGQHARLRGLLERLERHALEIIRAGKGSALELAGAFTEISTALADHARGEERALAKLLPSTAAAARALALLREAHRCQREELAAMWRMAACCDDAITLALAVRAFVSDVRLDMDAEDRRYLSARPLEGEPSDAEGERDA